MLALEPVRLWASRAYQVQVMGLSILLVHHVCQPGNTAQAPVKLWRSMSLNNETSSEPLYISAKWLLLNRELHHVCQPVGAQHQQMTDYLPQVMGRFSVLGLDYGFFDRVRLWVF